MLSVINNIAALKAQTHLQKASNGQSMSIKRLSTGLRINQASDDASGLAISEKMRTQIRGLRKANENAQNGISMLQTAEGALSETHSILQRMRELAVQASNGTLTSSDRIEVQKEVDALKDEIDGISTRTEFNTKKLLTGDATGFASFSTDQIEAVFHGPQVEDGEYQLEIDATPGTAQVQSTSIFRFKDGVQSVEELDLNSVPARHKMNISLGGAASVGGVDVTIDGVDYSFNFNIDNTDLETTITNLETAFLAAGGAGSDAGLASKMNLYTTDDTIYFEAKDPNADFLISIDEVGVGDNIPVQYQGEFQVNHRESESGISDLTSLNNLAKSPTEDARYAINIDEKGDQDMIADYLETVQGLGTPQNPTYLDDIYGITGEYLQIGSTGLREASLDYDIEALATGGPVNGRMDFNFDGDPTNTIRFEFSLAGGLTDNESANAIADAINGDNRLNEHIKAEADLSGGGIKIYALDSHKALDYKVQMTDALHNQIIFNQIGANDVHEAQFVTGLGKLGTSIDTAFTANSNSRHGGYALVEFTTDGVVGHEGLDAKVSFDGGNNWTYVENIWNNGGSNVIASDGYHSLEFNSAFTNDDIYGNFQSGDRMLIALNDNANDIPDPATYNSYSVNITNDITDSTMSVDFEILGENFSFNVDIDGALGADLDAKAEDIIDVFNDTIGSNGTNLSDMISVDWDGAHLTFNALSDDYSIRVVETGVGDNIDNGGGANGEGTASRRYQSTEGDLSRFDAFDPSSGQVQHGAVFSHKPEELDENITTLQTAYMDESTGQVTLGSANVEFDKGASNTSPIEGKAFFTANENGGGDVFESTQLKDIDRFYDADGNFVLGENGETFSIYNDFGDKADIYIDGGDTLGEVVEKIRDAITSDISAGGLGMRTDNFDMDENIVSFVKQSIPGSTESQQGTIVIRSPKSGTNGRLFFSSSEQLKTALGLSAIVEATENELEVTVRDGLSGQIIGHDITSDNIIHNVVKGVEIEFDQGYDLEATFNEATKTFEFQSGEGTQIESMKIVDNSTDFQIGANQGQVLNANIMRSDTHSLRVDRVQVTDQKSAKDAITQVDVAIEKISSERAKIGAWVNRLEHTMANLDIQEENQTAAESRIRDLNVAKETTALSKSQILSQASTSMLAQANQQAQGLMSLLR